MKAIHGSGRKFISGLVVSGALALVAVQAPAAHAAGTPTISASVLGRTVIHVSGFGFGPGDRVEVRDSVGGRVVTTASRLIVPPPPPPCKPGHLCTPFLPILGGFINVTMPPHVVHCLEERVAVDAEDLRTHARSNVVDVIVGTGLCRA